MVRKSDDDDESYEPTNPEWIKLTGCTLHPDKCGFCNHNDCGGCAYCMGRRTWKN